MSMAYTRLATTVALLGLVPFTARAADPTFFSTGSPDGKMATATRPDTGAPFEIEFGRRLLTHGT